MRLYNKFLKKPLLALLCGAIFFFHDQFLLPYGGSTLHSWQWFLSMVLPIGVCAILLLAVGQYRSTDWAWLFAGVAFHFLLIPIMLVPLCEHHKMEIGVLTGMVFAYFTSQRALVQYPLLAALVGTIGWLLSKKKQPEVSETPDA